MKKLWDNYVEFSRKYKYFNLLVILAVSTIVKTIYVFYFTEYYNYLVSDMGGYWSRAIERFNGNLFGSGQWIVWPPYYHIFITFVFKILYLLNLPINVAYILDMNIILSSVSVLFLYLISLRINKRQFTAVLIAAAYAFSYPFVYFNAFVLSEGFSLPLLIVAIWLVMKGVEVKTAENNSRENSPGLIKIFLESVKNFELKNFLILMLSGVILAFSVASRPSNGLLAIAFGLYALFANNKNIWNKEKLGRIQAVSQGILKGASFSIGFLVVLFLIVSEINYISRGNVKGLGVNGGLNFFFAQTKTYRVDSNSDYGYWILIPPGTVSHPENGTFTTAVPFQNQQYYFDMGWEYLMNNPIRWLEKLDMFNTLFFGPLLPSMPSAFGFYPTIHVFQYLLFFMTLFCGLSFLLFKMKEINKSALLLILSVPFFNFITYYIFNAEQRYLYSFAFTIYMLFFILLVRVIKEFKNYKKPVMIYLLALVACTAAFYSFNAIQEATMKSTIKLTLEQNIYPISVLDQKKEIQYTRTGYVDSMMFRNPRTLVHDKGRKFGFDQRFYLNAHAEFTVEQSDFYTFKIYSDAGSRLFIDGTNISELSNTNDIALRRGQIYLGKGDHIFSLDYFHDGGNQLLTGVYEKAGTPTNKLYYIGQDSPWIKFKEMGQ